jgi:leucine dehydrogenase
MTDLAQLIEEWDGTAVVVQHDKPTSTWIFVALHRTDRGMASGGTRMRAYPTPADGLRDAMRLAEGMTCKWAAIDFPFGGAKAVLAVPQPIAGAERTGLLRRYGRLVESLRGAFGTGVDLGTTAEDMRVIGEETRYVHGVERATGTTTDPGPFTARGVFAAIRTAVEHAFGTPDLAGRRVLVQGVGGVGAPLARLLAGAGARVLLTDVDAARAERLAAELGGRAVPAAAAVGTECDVFAPCAVGAVLDRDTIARLACRVVAGSANNQLAERADAERLRARGILYAPDYVVNAGGAIAMSMPSLGVTDAEAILARVDRIGESLGEVFAEAAARGESPLDAAERRVERCLAQRVDRLAELAGAAH